MSGSLLDAIAHPAVLSPNLLSSYGAGQDMAAKVWNNRNALAQQQAGQAYQQATDPVTGVVDPGKAQALIAADPRAALAALPTATSGQALKGAQLGFNSAQQGQLATGLGAVLTQGDDQQNGSTYRAWIKQMVSQGTVDASHQAAALAAMPPDGSPPSAFRQFGTKLLIGSLAGPQVAQQAFGAPITVDDGQQVLGGTQASPIMGGGIRISGPGVAVGLPSATQRAGLVPGPPGPGGAPTQETLGSSLSRQGLDQNGNPLPNPAFSGLPAALRNPAAPPATGTPVQTGIGPGATSAMGAQGVQSSQAYQDTAAAAVKAVSQRSLLQSMAGDASQFTTGWGADRIKAVKSAAVRLGNIFGVDPDKLAANEDLDKIAAQLADAQGAGSDAKLAVNQGANPSSHNTPAGLSLILNKLTGNADYLAARGQLAATYQQTQDPTGANARQFETTVGASLDPRVFQFNRLTPAQQSQYLSEMSGPAKDAFKLSYARIKAMQVLPGG